MRRSWVRFPQAAPTEQACAGSASPCLSAPVSMTADCCRLMRTVADPGVSCSAVHLSGCSATGPSLLVFSPETGSTTSHELLTTGQVARLLGCSRQHVVDLCTSGVLPYVSVRTHRRVRRRDAELLAGGTLTRDQERSLWLHRVVAGRLALETDRVMELAAKNLRRLRKVHTEGMAARWLDRCRRPSESARPRPRAVARRRSASSQNVTSSLGGDAPDPSIGRARGRQRNPGSATLCNAAQPALWGGRVWGPRHELMR